MFRFRFALVALLALEPATGAWAQGVPDIARRVSDIASLALDEYQLGVVSGQVISVAEFEEARLFLEEWPA